MKQFYPTPSAFRCAKSFFFSFLFLCSFFAAKAQVYYTSLSGPNEAPPNASAGTGKAVLTISGTSMRLQTSFSGLTGNTVAAHIHAPTANPLTGTVGVATPLPTFPGFPLGVTAGTYDRTFDMTLASSYSPGFLSANGGTPLSAFAALKGAIEAGKSYLNIHTNVFPGGEIRGFFLPCPTITATIPDAVALSRGVLPNTVYPAYAPAASLTLRATVSGGTAPYTYTWSTGAATPSILVAPTSTTTYTVAVTDVNGCPAATAQRTVAVIDVSSGKKGDKIDVCHNGKNVLSIAAAAVEAHLNHGDRLGKCSDEAPLVRVRESGREQPAAAFGVRVLSNPSPNYFELQLSGIADQRAHVRVFDLQGRLVETRPSLPLNQTLRLGMTYRAGTYLVQITQGTQVQTLRLIKSK